MVLFDDRRDDMPLIDKQQWEVLMNAGDIPILINWIQTCSDEVKKRELQSLLIVKMKYLKEECDKLINLYKREGVK